ncbi:putative ribonuclease H-like domain-containing protein [Tanacetum coccineum]
MTMRTKPDVDALSLDDQYNNLMYLQYLALLYFFTNTSRKEALTWECTTKGTHDGKKKRDSFYQHQEARKQEKNQMGLLTMDDGIVNWGEHTENEETNHALMAISSSSEVSLCSKTCIDSYNTLKTLCDEQMNQLGDQEAQILAYSQAVKKLEAQLVTFQKQQLSLNEKLTFQANEIYEKDEKLKKYRRIGMKVGPQEPEPSVSDDRSSKYSTCQSNDSARSIGTSSEHSVDPEFEILRDHPLKNMVDRGIFDSGCSGHMTGNKDQLEDFEEFNGGSVTFGGSKGYITGKGKIRVGNLDFDSMPNENQILLKVPRHHNMYSFDMKTHSLIKGFACLIAKATSDKSRMWHMRLGHINFKNLNKLVKGNLVRGLPSKVFRNDHTCVACHKGKQHRASCKAKLERLITEPLHTLHMDLFGPTSVKSINHASDSL